MAKSKDRRRFNGDVIAECGQNESIARLFAASRELLEACEAAARGEHHPACLIAKGRGWTTINRDDCTCHVKKARAAIAKATQP